MPRARSDEIRRRPETVRYFWLANGHTNLHSGMSYGGLNHALTHDAPITMLQLADMVTGRVAPIAIPVDHFLALWREHYTDPAFDYFAWEKTQKRS